MFANKENRGIGAGQAKKEEDNGPLSVDILEGDTKGGGKFGEDDFM